MRNYDKLVEATAEAQAYLLEAPIIRDVASGRVSVDMYIAFLTNAYHHVRFTVPLMMATGARTNPSNAKLLNSLREYIDEEIGHEQWILNDLAACNADADAVAESNPNFETEVMVRYVRDYINQVDPGGFLGMVHVLEGTSTSLATGIAELIQGALKLPDEAFSYLRSHGELDIEHVEFFRQLLDNLSVQDMGHVIYVAQRVFRLYGNVLRSIPRIESVTEVAGNQSAA